MRTETERQKREATTMATMKEVGSKKRRRPSTWGATSPTLILAAAAYLLTCASTAGASIQAASAAQGVAAAAEHRQEPSLLSSSSTATTTYSHHDGTHFGDMPPIQLQEQESRQNWGQLIVVAAEGTKQDDDLTNSKAAPTLPPPSLSSLLSSSRQLYWTEELNGSLGVKAPAQEDDVTPSPSMLASSEPTISPVTLAPQQVAVTPAPQQVAVTPAPQQVTISPEPSNEPSSSMKLLSKTAVEFPVNFNAVLRVPKDSDTMEWNDIIQDTEQALEDYMTEGLSKVETDIVQLKNVRLTSTLMIRRRVSAMAATKERSQHSQLRQRLPTIEASSRRVQEEQELNLEVTGLIEFAISQENDGDVSVLEESLRNKVKSELDTLLQQESLDQVTRDVVVAALEGDNTTGGDETDNGDTDSDPNGMLGSENVADEANQVIIPDDEDIVEKPTLLSIIFGFALVGLATAGLCAYAVIFYKKRQKRLRKRQRMKESVQYKFPTATTTTPTMGSAVGMNHRRPTAAPASAKTAAMTPESRPVDDGDDHDDDSEGSSYKGGLGAESEEGPGDDFARELQLAASLDQEAWDSHQRKKDFSRDVQESEALSLSRTNSADEDAYHAAAAAAGLAVYDPRSPGTPPSKRSRSSHDMNHANHFAAQADGLSPIEGRTSSSSRWPRSFPYGDEEDEKKNSHDEDDRFPQEEGVEWPAESTISNIMGHGYDDDDENDDSWDNDGPKQANSSSFLAASRAALDRLGKNFEIYGSGSTSNDNATSRTAPATTTTNKNQVGNDDTEDGSKNTSESLRTSDIVLEVERLSKFVKRYEQKKERRNQRQHDVDVKLDRQSPPSRSGGGNDFSYGEVASGDSRSFQGGMSSAEMDSPLRGISQAHARQPPINNQETGKPGTPTFASDARNRMRMIEQAKALMANNGVAAMERHLAGNNVHLNSPGRVHARQGAAPPLPQPAQFDPDTMELAPDPSLNHDETLSASDSESETWSDPQHRLGGSQQRLGITPFSVQKPPGVAANSTSHQQMAHPKHQRKQKQVDSLPSHHDTSTGSGGGLSSLRGQEAMFEERDVNSYSSRSSRPHSMGSSLSALRDSSAILDGTTSDVGAPSMVPFDEIMPGASTRTPKSKPPPTIRSNNGVLQAPRVAQAPRRGMPRRHNSMPSHNINQQRPPENGTVGEGGATKKFNNIRAMFERTAERQDGIFPPDQHWQFTSFKTKQQQQQRS